MRSSSLSLRNNRPLPRSRSLQIHHLVVILVLNLWPVQLVERGPKSCPLLIFPLLRVCCRICRRRTSPSRTPPRLCHVLRCLHCTPIHITRHRRRNIRRHHPRNLPDLRRNTPKQLLRSLSANHCHCHKPTFSPLLLSPPV